MRPGFRRPPFCSIEANGKAPQHITGEGVSYVARLPMVAPTAEEWLADIKREREIDATNAAGAGLNENFLLKASDPPKT